MKYINNKTHLIIGLILFFVLMFNIKENYTGEIDYSLFISILSLIVVLLFYDKFGLKGHQKQKELEKTKEFYSILVKSKYYELPFNTIKLTDKYISLDKIILDNDKPKIMKRELLDKLYSDLNEIHNHSFFSDDLFSKISLDNLHYSECEKFIFSDNTNFVVIDKNNYFPFEDFNDKLSIKKNDYRVIDKSFFETINEIIKILKKEF